LQLAQKIKNTRLANVGFILNPNQQTNLNLSMNPSPGTPVPYPQRSQFQKVDDYRQHFGHSHLIKFYVTLVLLGILNLVAAQG